MPTTREALSPELRTRLRDSWQHDSAAMHPLEIDSEKSLRLFLSLLVPEHTFWGTTVETRDGHIEEVIPGSAPVEKLIGEFTSGECRLTLIEWKQQRHILRDIRTATLTVFTSILSPTERNPKHRRNVWLREYHLKNGVKVWRRHRNSMSEKLLPGETFRDGAIRAILQELSIDPDPQYLETPYFLAQRDFPDIQFPNELRAQHPFIYRPDVRDTPRYPGILTRNELEHFYWIMPEKHVSWDGYHEAGTNHYFEWFDSSDSLSE